MLDNIKKEILQCSQQYCDSDWEKISSAMQTIFKLQYKARHEGILVLEDGLDEMEDKTLQYFLRMVVNGLDAKFIEECMENLFRTNSFQGLEAFLFLIDAYGALYIQAGNSEDTITMLFQSFVPPARHGDVFYDEGRIRKSLYKKIKAAIEQGKLCDAINFTPTEDAFSKEIMSLSDEDFKILEEEIYHFYYEDFEWKAALKYSTFQVIERFIKDEQIDYIVRFVDSVNKAHTKEDSDKAKEKILSAIEKIRWKKNLVTQGKATEAFEMEPINDDFAKTISALSAEQIKALVEKTDKDDCHYIMKCMPSEVANKFASSIDFSKAYPIFRYLGRCSRWDKERIETSKQKILVTLETIKTESAK